MKERMIKQFSKVIAFVLSFVLINVFLNGCTTADYVNRVESYDNSKVYNIDILNRYGQWVDIPTYGHVWKPFVVSDWEPFHNGHWIRSENNWVWISYEPFGWVVYHYGYWYDDFIQGWVWIPDNNGWMPANVEWYSRDNYICWAPRPPKGINYGDPWEEKEKHHWHIVTSDHFTDENIGHSSETHTASSPIRNSGERNIPAPTVNAPTPVRNNDKHRPDNNTPKDAPPSIYVRPLSELNRSKATEAPAAEEIEKRNGKKIESVPITKEPVKLKDKEINKVVVPEPMRRNDEKFERDVKEKVLTQPQKNEDKAKERKNRE